LQLTNVSISFYRREDTKVDLKAMRWETFELIHLVQDRERWRAVVIMVVNMWK